MAKAEKRVGVLGDMKMREKFDAFADVRKPRRGGDGNAQNVADTVGVDDGFGGGFVVERAGDVGDHKILVSSFWFQVSSY